MELVRKEPLPEYQRSLSGAVHTIECAIEDALVDIACSSERGFEGGDAWTQWIVDLAHTFEKKEPLKSTASKDTNRPLSPFVRFVKALQSTIEKKYRRHQTDAALSLAVANALKHKEKTQKREFMSRVGGSKTPPKRGKRG